MKTITLLFFLLTGMMTYSQNPLVDGIGKTPLYEEEDEATYLELEDFSVTMGDCRLVYGYNGTFIDGYVASTYEFKHVITVNYKNITKIEVYSDAIVVVAKEIKTDVDGDDPYLAESQKEEGLMTIYFSSLEDSQAAATWLKEQVSVCGGTAEIVTQ